MSKMNSTKDEKMNINKLSAKIIKKKLKNEKTERKSK